MIHRDVLSDSFLGHAPENKDLCISLEKAASEYLCYCPAVHTVEKMIRAVSNDEKAHHFRMMGRVSLE